MKLSKESNIEVQKFRHIISSKEGCYQNEKEKVARGPYRWAKMQTEKLGFGPKIPNFEFAESRAEQRAEHARKKKMHEDKKKNTENAKMLISHKSRRHGRRDDRGIELWFKKSSLALICFYCFTHFHHLLHLLWKTNIGMLL